MPHPVDGRLSARERLDALFDPGSLVELGRLVGDDGPDDVGVVTGRGSVGGRAVFAFSQDAASHGGSVSGRHAARVCEVVDLAVRLGAPVVGLYDSVGARVQDGIDSVAGYGEMFGRFARASGHVPQLAAVLGDCAGAGAFGPALADLLVMVDDVSSVFVSGPEVVRAVTAEAVTREALGGASTHATRSGVAHFTAPDERACLALLRELIGLLPSSHADDPPRGERGDPADRESAALDVVAAGPPGAHDVRDVIAAVVDRRRLLEVQADHAMNVVCAFARVDGRPVGVVANQPTVLAGCLDAAACVKAARFVRFCDAFNVPLVTFVDVPGFLPGADQEHGGVVKHGAKLLFAYAEATVPTVTVVVRKAYGAAYAMMGSRHLGAGVNVAWPGAELAVMGAEGAVQALYGPEIERAADPAGRRAQLVEEYRARVATPHLAATRGYLDAVIEPRATRRHVAGALERLCGRREDRRQKKHGNVPL